VSRWVLEGGSSSRRESEKKAAQERGKEFGSIIQDTSDALGTQVDQGGRWERLIEEDHWEKVELLEDLEDAGDVGRLSDDETLVLRKSHPTAKPRQAIVFREASTPIAPPEIAPNKIIKEDLEDFSSMLDSLAIVERAPGHVDVKKVLPSQSKEESIKQSRRPKVRLVDRTGKEEQAIESDDEEFKAQVSDADSDDLDILAELSMRSELEGGEDIVSTILASSRNLQKMDDGNFDDLATNDLTEEESKQRQEEDDLFTLAWQARDEEIAKGNWVE